MPNDLDRRLAQYKRENGIDEQSEALRQVCRRGLEDWEGDQSSPPGKGVLTRGAELALISGLFAAILGVGLETARLYEIAAGFGAIAVALYCAYGILARYQTGSWTGAI